MEWTKEYCEMTHLAKNDERGKHIHGLHWYTLDKLDTETTILKEWYPGCQFSPRETFFEGENHVERAKAEAERLFTEKVGA